MFSIIVVPPPTTEDERNRTPITRPPGEHRAYGPSAYGPFAYGPFAYGPFAYGTFRILGRPDRAGASR
ncbi:hypothetical protein ACH5AI_03945 [Streptomyces collinus]|uniref:hypothetical protein n=1 Tax=Streptomyces collinus TaxID=42684 RepID=UPI0037971050